jgi:hypothetical protein
MDEIDHWRDIIPAYSFHGTLREVRYGSQVVQVQADDLDRSRPNELDFGDQIADIYTFDVSRGQEYMGKWMGLGNSSGDLRS